VVKDCDVLVIAAWPWEAEWARVSVSTKLTLVSGFWRQAKSVCLSPGWGGVAAIVLSFSCSVFLGQSNGSSAYIN